MTTYTVSVQPAQDTALAQALATLRAAGIRAELVKIWNASDGREYAISLVGYHYDRSNDDDNDKNSR